MCKILQTIIGSNCQVLMRLLLTVADVLCVIILKSDQLPVIYLMAASATHELLVEFSLSKESDDPLVDS